MNVQDVFSGAWGSSAAVSIMGAFIVFFVKRSLLKYDKHIDNQYQKIGEINRDKVERHEAVKDAINQLRVELSIVSTQVKGLTHLVDKINNNGCRYCRHKMGMIKIKGV